MLGTGDRLGWQWSLLLIVETFIVSILLCISKPAQPYYAVFGVLSPFVLYSLSAIPTPLSTHLLLLVQHKSLELPVLFGEIFYKQQPVLRKLSKTVKWSIFCESFVCKLTIYNHWLSEILNIVYHVNFNVQFSQTTITYVHKARALLCMKFIQNSCRM